MVLELVQQVLDQNPLRKARGDALMLFETQPTNFNRLKRGGQPGRLQSFHNLLSESQNRFTSLMKGNQKSDTARSQQTLHISATSNTPFVTALTSQSDSASQPLSSHKKLLSLHHDSSSTSDYEDQTEADYFVDSPPPSLSPSPSPPSQHGSPIASEVVKISQLTDSEIASANGLILDPSTGMFVDPLEGSRQQQFVKKCFLATQEDILLSQSQKDLLDTSQDLEVVDELPVLPPVALHESGEASSSEEPPVENTSFPVSEQIERSQVLTVSQPGDSIPSPGLETAKSPVSQEDTETPSSGDITVQVADKPFLLRLQVSPPRKSVEMPSVSSPVPEPLSCPVPPQAQKVSLEPMGLNEPPLPDFVIERYFEYVPHQFLCRGTLDGIVSLKVVKA